MSRPTFASLFGGGRLADIGAMQAGCDLLWDVEINPELAEAGQQLPGKTYIQSVTEVDWSSLQPPDILWVSPPCPNFSIAKQGATETEQDIKIAQSVADSVAILSPSVFILENVEGYQRSQSLALIENALYRLGYWVDRQVLNAADFGVPQTRRRLILRAVKGAFLPALPDPALWRGWFNAIADLLDDLPDSQLAQWQIDRLPDGFLTSLLPASDMRNFSLRNADEPARTVEVSSGNLPKAILCGTHQSGGVAVGTREGSIPSFTITANSVGRVRAVLVSGTAGDFHHGKVSKSVATRVGDSPSLTVNASAWKCPPKVCLGYRVVQLSPRCLARLQSVPDWYALPSSNRIACTVVGNGVPPLMSEAIVSGLIPYTLRGEL